MIKTIGVKQFYKIIYFSKQKIEEVPREQWLTFDRGKFLVIDNRLGQCDVREFSSVSEAITYSKGVGGNGITNNHL